MSQPQSSSALFLRLKSRTDYAFSGAATPGGAIAALPDQDDAKRLDMTLAEFYQRAGRSEATVTALKQKSHLELARECLDLVYTGHKAETLSHYDSMLEHLDKAGKTRVEAFAKIGDPLGLQRFATQASYSDANLKGWSDRITSDLLPKAKAAPAMTPPA